MTAKPEKTLFPSFKGKYKVVPVLNKVPLHEDSSLSGYGMNDRDSRVRFPAGAGNFSLHHRVQNGSGTHSASYPMGTRGSFPGSKAAGA
jgi:hypothetical protein